MADEKRVNLVRDMVDAIKSHDSDRIRRARYAIDNEWGYTTGVTGHDEMLESCLAWLAANEKGSSGWALIDSTTEPN